MRYTIRMKKKGAFKYLINKGNFKKENNIIVYCCYNHQKSNYFGVCVSKRNGNSVERNKLKRWAREVYTHEEEKLKKGFNIIIMYKKSTTKKELGYSIVEQQVLNAFKELNLYDNKKNN